MKARAIATTLLIACLPFGIPLAAVVILIRRWSRS